MTRFERRRRRIRQVFAWLKDEFDSPVPVRLRVPKEAPKFMKGCFGVCCWNVKGEAMIWIGPSATSQAISTTLHEYAHVMTDGQGSAEGHGDEFYRTLGRIERQFFYGGGNRASKGYKV